MDVLLKEVRACRYCENKLPLRPRPVLRMAGSARILIIGQAPGSKVHASGIPWDDRSGNRLRSWLRIDRETFYDERRIAIMPMGFCYPGRFDRRGDKPPRRECARLWHARLLAFLRKIELTLLVGSYAQRYYLGKANKKSMTETVLNWRNYAPAYIPTPHPSWRTIGWQKKNPWFDADVLPRLRDRVSRLL